MAVCRWTCRGSQFAVLLSGALTLLWTTPVCCADTQWRQRLQQEQPYLLRLLDLAAPGSSLSRADLNRAGEAITAWALDSESQAVQDALSLLVDKERLDYLQAMRDVEQTIRYDGDAGEWPEWTCLWKGYETPWLLQEGDFTAVRAIYDGECVSVAIDLPQQPPSARWSTIRCGSTWSGMMLMTCRWGSRRGGGCPGTE